MFMRLLSAKSDDMEVFRSFYDSVVIGELQKIEGCLFAGLLQSNKDAREGISLTLWDSRDHADAYEESGIYKKLLEQAGAALYWLNASDEAIKLGNPILMNMIMLGAACRLNEFPFEVEHIRQTLKVMLPDSKLEINAKALEIGFHLAVSV